MNVSRTPLRRWSLVILGVTLLTLGSVAGAGAQEVVPVDEFGATAIEADATVQDPRPHTWDRVVVASDGVTLNIFFWMGIEQCNGLHSVNITTTDSGIDLRLLTGIPAGVPTDIVCIELAQLYRTTAVLDEPLITGGE